MRVPGGLSVTLDEFGLATQILLAHDPLIVADVHAARNSSGQQEAKLQRDFAVHQLNTVQATCRPLAVADARRPGGVVVRCGAERSATCDRQLAAGDIAAARPSTPNARADRCD